MEKTPKANTDQAFLERLRNSAPEVLKAEMDFEKATIRIMHTKGKSERNRKGEKSSRKASSR